MGRPYPFVSPPPMEHQLRGLRSLIDNDGVHGLLWDMGTGKSRVVLDYLGMLTMAKGSCDALICVPLDAVDTWPDEAHKWLPPEVLRNLEIIIPEGTIEEKATQLSSLADDFNSDHLRLVVINHDAFKYRHKATGDDGKKLKTVTVQDRMVDAIATWVPDIAVYDESHRALKTHNSNTCRAWKKIGRMVDKRIIMTGTPSPKNPLDVFGQWLFLNPKRFGDKWGMFRYTYAVYGGYLGREIVRFKNLERLQAEIAKDATVVTKDEALDLPPLTEQTIPVRLGPREREAYIQMGESYLVELEGKERSLAASTLTRILRLRQITGGSIGLLDDAGQTQVRDLGDSKLKVCVSKTTDLTELDEKVVIFAHFVRDIERITAAVDKATTKDVPVYSMRGSTPKEERRRMRKEFQAHEGAAVFIAQMRTASLAINELVVASNVIFYSMSERRDDYDQAKARLYRQGQTRPVTVWHLVVPNSVDAAVLHSHREKKRLEQVITGQLEDILTLGEGNERIAA